MAAIVQRGASFRIIFRPLTNVDVSALGTPFISIQQELIEITPEAVVDAQNNLVYADVDETQSLALVDDVTTRAQLMFSNDDGTSYRFPIHEIYVTDTLFGSYEDEVANRVEQAEELAAVQPEQTQEP